MAAPTRSAWARLAFAVRKFYASEVRGKARLLSVGMLGLLLAISGLNVINSYVGRDFMTALVNRQEFVFYRLALLYVGVFAASTVAAAVQSYTQGRLGLLWREWLTERLDSCYLKNRTYLGLRTDTKVDNPDERISEDVRAFTDSVLGFFVMLLNGAITAIAFAGVTWSISPALFGVCVGYAVLGSVGTILLGRRLTGLNAAQLAREADFRAALMHVRENAASVAVTRAEPSLLRRISLRLSDLVANFRRILNLNLRLSLFTGGYNYLIQIIPALVVGPLYLRGDVEFGVVTQSAMAFAQLVGALSLVITQFGSISSFAAVASRVNELTEAMEREHETTPTGFTTVVSANEVVIDGVTLANAGGERILLSDLSLKIAVGQRVEITGRNELAQMALFRALAGLWPDGRGQIALPPPSDILFVPQTPYMIPGSLRDQFRPLGNVAEDDRQIRTVLSAVGLADVLAQVGGLDLKRDWPHLLTQGEQQAVAMARVLLGRPRFAVLDRMLRALSPAVTQEVFRWASGSRIGLIIFTGQDEPTDWCERTLELKLDGSWSVRDNSRSRLPGNRLATG